MTQYYYGKYMYFKLTSNICRISATLLAYFLEFKNSLALFRRCADTIFVKFCCTVAIFVFERITLWRKKSKIFSKANIEFCAQTVVQNYRLNKINCHYLI